MARKVRKCAFDGCPEEVSSGYCFEHRPTRQRSPSSRVTGTRRWREQTKPSVLKPGARCAECGRPAETVDHVEPVSQGGAHHDRRNLRPICHRCNAKKGGR